jgi:hypothetical protein
MEGAPVERGGLHEAIGARLAQDVGGAPRVGALSGDLQQHRREVGPGHPGQ